MYRVRFRDPAGLVRLGKKTAEGVNFGGRTYSFDAVDILPPCDPTKIVCVGMNYESHVEESGGDIPDRPMLFLKPPNTVAGHRDVVSIPGDAKRVDYEAELAVIIAEQCRNVVPDDATNVIAGYTCLNDVSNRDEQFNEQNWVRGKAFDNSAPMGPWLATPDEMPDDATIELRVNGEVKQLSSIDEFIFSVEEIIAEITEYVTLESGDVIATGTPEGVGPLNDGDTVSVEIEGIGILENTIEEF